MIDKKDNLKSKTASFWTEKYNAGDTGWDLGIVAPPLKNYVDSLENKDLRILIPGAGMGWEVEYLHNRGFKNVFMLDISPIPLKEFKDRVPDFPQDHLLNIDFFELEMPFDLIIEQTFFCAIEPILRPNYAKHVHQLLRKKGRIAGLLFASEFAQDGPPFGGVKAEYENLFSKYFKILTLNIAHNSYPARMGNELFFEFEKKSI